MEVSVPVGRIDWAAVVEGTPDGNETDAGSVDSGPVVDATAEPDGFEVSLGSAEPVGVVAEPVDAILDPEDCAVVPLGW